MIVDFQTDIEYITENTARCDGDGTHPLIYLDLSNGEIIACPYCSRKFKKKKKKKKDDKQ